MTNVRAKRGSRTEARSSDLGNRNHLTCPGCGGQLHLTTDSRLTTLADGVTKVIRRRRDCADCGKRHSTLEVTEATMFAPVMDLLDRQINELNAIRDRIRGAGK